MSSLLLRLFTSSSSFTSCCLIPFTSTSSVNAFHHLVFLLFSYFYHFLSLFISTLHLLPFPSSFFVFFFLLLLTILGAFIHLLITSSSAVLSTTTSSSSQRLGLGKSLARSSWALFHTVSANVEPILLSMETSWSARCGLMQSSIRHFN